ncbi:MAG: GrpB family protein, partial [Lachnospiraceae bacterium]|nr:GrpB family protein [Lachnospiraceae bacterium]
MKLGLRRGTVALEPHSREWETAAQETIAKLKEILPGTLTDAQHVGSTAVRGLCAKPIIDLAVAVTDFDTLLTRNGELEKNGFHFRGQDHPGQYLYVCGDGDLVTHHVHAVLRDSEEWKDYVGLRDYLRTHPEDAQAYAALKETLAARFPEERSRYTAMKHDFIQTLLEKARTAKTGPGAGEGGMMETRFPYALIDLHCDTLTRWTRHRTGGPDTLDDPIHVLTLSTIPPEVHWAQLYAIFIPDELRGPDAIAYYEENRLSFHRQMEKFADRVASCVTPDEMEKIWAEGKT